MFEAAVGDDSRATHKARLHISSVGDILQNFECNEWGRGHRKKKGVPKSM